MLLSLVVVLAVSVPDMAVGCGLFGPHAEELRALAAGTGLAHCLLAFVTVWLILDEDNGACAMVFSATETMRALGYSLISSDHLQGGIALVVLGIGCLAVGLVRQQQQFPGHRPVSPGRSRPPYPQA